MRCYTMKIKQVEQEVGISVHSIRFYEEMGLIKIQRKEDSKYRDFTEHDVKKLKEIKLFRELGITIEEIKRYYANEISLQDLMDHQLIELKAQHNDMELKEKLCADIKDSNAPLIAYTVEKYEEILQHKKEKTPYEEAGSLISSWNHQKHSRKKIILIECITFPIIWFFSSWIVLFIANIPHILQTHTMDIQYHWFTLLLSFIFALIVSWSDFIVVDKFPYDLYEFHEKGIYYFDETKRKYIQLLKAAWKNDVESCYQYVAYDDIRILKIWFHMVAKAPINGGNAYQIDLFLYTKDDELLRINTGMFGVSDEKVKLTVEILKEHADKVIDPYHIIEHLDDSREDFYKYLDDLYWKREHIRVFGKEK
ncbi:MerR family transcriptional regulator [Absiella sp. AM10-20]|jgi:DNA-binding transcriptional MerR regulator|nr:MerR family transcriptional regulator [Absiella sp. AM22-9]RGB57285.1 MerR family transcriptional regulator [Absiella sp. AM10-20]RHU06247.1 MerR family transcriptional regulator [Absiella sp. AM27-20]